MKIERGLVGYAALPMAQPTRTASHSVSATHNTLVELHADGLAGQGAALTLAPGHGRAVREVAVELVSALVGEDVADVPAYRRRMLRSLNLTGRTGIGMLAVAALDTALWDLQAQTAGVPLYAALGGSHRQLPVYAQPGWLSTSVEGLVEEALGVAEQGFRFYKMRVGSGDLRVDLARVARVREALPAEVALMVDANQGWSREEAREACAAFDDLGLYWIEEPLDAFDFDGYAELARRVRTPIAAGESLFGTAELMRLAGPRGASVLMPDLQHCGGPTGFLEAAGAIAGAGLPVSNHLFTEVSIHVLAACESPLLVERMPGWWDNLYDRPLAIEDGMLAPPVEPGIAHRFSERARAELRPVAP